MTLALLGPEQGARLWIEVGLWALPALAGALRFARGARGRRAAWLVVAVACAVIASDKVFDLLTLVHHAGQDLIRDLDPEHRLRGPHAWMRWALLGGLFLAGVAALWLLVRVDRAIGPGKRLALVGLVGVMAYLGARMLPALNERLIGSVGLSAEAVCYLAVLVGLARGDVEDASGEAPS